MTSAIVGMSGLRVDGADILK